MTKAKAWIHPLIVTAMASGCALLQDPKAKTGDKINTDASGIFTLPKIETGVSQTRQAISEFKELNSSSNFTMPIGNNFTMPIGNNFTMPIGNNLIGNAGVGYRVAALGERILFGFVPIPKDTAIAVAGGGAMTLPAYGSTAVQTATIGGPSDPNIEATLALQWWDDSKTAGLQGYKSTLNYTRARTTVAGGARDVSGSYSIRMSGPPTPGNWAAPDTSKTDGAIFLGQNSKPASIQRRIDAMDMKLGSTTVASVSVEQEAYQNYEISLPSGANNQDPNKVAIQVPGTVNVVGFLTRPDGSSSLGVNLAASLNASARLFTLSGWLKPCPAATCTATAAGTLQTTSGEIREEFTLDVQSATSRLVFTKYPKAGETYGWRLTMYFDYAVSLLKGTGGTTALTGDLWLIEASGNKAVGGKLADITADAAGNPKINYPDGTSDVWQLF